MFQNIEMTGEYQKIANSWKDESRFISVHCLFSPPSKVSSMLTVDRDRGFMFYGCPYILEIGPNPTYYFYLWWNGGYIEIETKENTETDENNTLTTAYNVLLLNIYQDKTNFSKNFLKSVIEEALDTYTRFRDSKYSADIQNVVVSFKETKIKNRKGLIGRLFRAADEYISQVRARISLYRSKRRGTKFIKEYIKQQSKNKQKKSV